MLIPEVFSACAVYVNGEQTASSGSVSPYRPYIKDLVFLRYKKKAHLKKPAWPIRRPLAAAKR